MKWLFFSLCTINVVMLVLQWSESRDLSKHERYLAEKNVRELRLVGSVSRSKDKACTLVGPFDVREKAENIRLAFNDSQIGADLVFQEVELAPAYWVYFSDFEQGQSASAQLREFQAKGLDAFVIAKGDLKGNISLGVFKNIDSARRMINIANKKGYKTKLSEIKRSDDVFWLSVSLSYRLDNKRKIDSILAEKDVSSELREIFCKSVASQK